MKASLGVGYRRPFSYKLRIVLFYQPGLFRIGRIPLSKTLRLISIDSYILFLYHLFLLFLKVDDFLEGLLVVVLGLVWDLVFSKRLGLV